MGEIDRPKGDATTVVLPPDPDPESPERRLLAPWWVLALGCVVMYLAFTVPAVGSAVAWTLAVLAFLCVWLLLAAFVHRLFTGKA